ncbi:BON domain-containing protein [Tahibacter amnicola]|uniref:BON domain-containing protein n=1 Tax=Tahibacter amnicola TaxID=2976241 RepID=A0ABY6BER7_9GAMM|nr:BON domain-containing protein [Tahibacter amnicola]UXI67753.1 BON domain-containing protein [Tahibacter amnicola]
MIKSLRLPALLLLAAPLLGGCFAAVVGGAAAGASAAHDRRSFAQVIDDKNIQLSAYDNFNKDKELALKNNVSITVYNGVMLLAGEVRTPELKERAERRVEGFEGVRKLVNDIQVREPEGFWSQRRDNTITAHTKTALLDIVDLPGFDPTRVNITTVHRTVYLMGLLTREEADRVAEVARNVAGVERVVRVLEYKD